MTDTLRLLAESTVVTPPSPALSGTTLTVVPGEGDRFPDTAAEVAAGNSGSFVVMVCPVSEEPGWATGTGTGGNFEAMRATRVGDTLTLTRAQYDTDARAILPGDRIFQPEMPSDPGQLFATITTPVTVDYTGGWLTLQEGDRFAYADSDSGNVHLGVNQLVPADIGTNWTTHRDRIVPAGFQSAKGDRFWTTNVVMRMLANPSQLITGRAGPDPPALKAIAANAAVGDTSLVISNAFRAYDPGPDTWGSIFLETQYNKLDEPGTVTRYYSLQQCQANYTGSPVTPSSSVPFTLSLSSIPQAAMRTKLNIRGSTVNKDVIFTAVASGTSTLNGNAVSVQYVDPGANSQSLSVSVVGNAITVHLATNSSGAITSTAAAVKTAVNADVSASALVTASLPGGTGAGVVSAIPKTYLLTFQAASVGNPQPLGILQGNLQPNKIGNTSQPSRYEITYTGLAWNSGASTWDFTGCLEGYGPASNITTGAVFYQARLDGIPASGDGSIKNPISSIRGVNRHLPGKGDKVPGGAGDNLAYGGYPGLTGHLSGGTAIYHQPVQPWWNAWRDRDTFGEPGCWPGGTAGKTSADTGFSIVEVPMQLGFDPPMNGLYALGSSWRVSTSSRGTNNIRDRLTVEDDGLARLYTNGLIATLGEPLQPVAVCRARTGGDPGSGLTPASSGTPSSDYPANTRSYRISVKDVSGNETTASGYATVGRTSAAKHTDKLTDITILPRITDNPSSVDLTWNPVPGAVTYRIYVGVFSNSFTCVGDTAAGSTTMTVSSGTGLPTSGGRVTVILADGTTDSFLYDSRSGTVLSGIPTEGADSLEIDVPDGTTCFSQGSTLGYYEQSPQNSNVGSQTFTDAGQSFTSTTVTRVGSDGALTSTVQRSFLGGDRVTLGYRGGDYTAGTGGVTIRYSGDGTTHAATVDGSLAIGGLSFTTLTPTALSGSVNGYAPTGYATASWWRLDSNGAYNITGINSGAAGGGGMLLLQNLSAFTLTLKNLSGSSTSAYQFSFGADFALLAGQTATIIYDATLTKWIMVAHS